MEHLSTKTILCLISCQVKNVNLSEGEQLSIRGVDEGGALLILANETLLVEGQVIRSPTNVISVFFRSFSEGGMGNFQLHYQSESISVLSRMSVYIQNWTIAKESPILDSELELVPFQVQNRGESHSRFRTRISPATR